MIYFKKVAIIGKPNANELIEPVLTLARCLKEHGVEVFIDCCNYCSLEYFHTGKLKDWLNILDLVIILGGDGTLLSVARTIADYDIPIIGINQGKLGFMTDVSISDMQFSILKVIIEGKYSVEQRSLIKAEIYRDGHNIYNSLALNDIVISRGAIGNMIEFEMSIDEQFVQAQKSDGIIISTPTGSTAYSLAAGGPIIHPEARVFSIVPICPQSLSNRPIVIGDEVTIKLYLIRENATQIHYDGQEFFDLKFHDTVIVTKSLKPLKLLHPDGYNYYYTLRTKLDWSKRVS